MNTALYSDKVKGKQGSAVHQLMGTGSNIPDVFLPMPENTMHLGFARMAFISNIEYGTRKEQVPNKNPLNLEFQRN